MNTNSVGIVNKSKYGNVPSCEAKGFWASTKVAGHLLSLVLLQLFVVQYFSFSPRPCPLSQYPISPQ